MSIFNSKKEKEGVGNPIDEIRNNKDITSQTFVNQSSSNKTTTKMTNIANQTTIEGILKIEGDISIEGKIKGSVTAKGKITIGASGIVEGDVLSQEAEIFGAVSGKVEVAKLLALRGNAVINGDIHTDKLVIEQEARFNGKCFMGKNNDNKSSGPAPNVLKGEPTAAPTSQDK